MCADDSPEVWALVGATATGKTGVAEWLADRLGCGIVCADSRQVFRELSAGTGKPTAAQLAHTPHALFDALAVGQHASAGWYARAAGEACRETIRAGRRALLVGGSGFYLKALMSGLSGEPPHDTAVRARLAAEASRLGAPALHQRLRALDPVTASRLHPSDVRRVSRALEVVEASGHPLSWWHAQITTPGFRAIWRVAELVVEPATLAPRIDARTREMFENGLIDEARALLAEGREGALRALRAVGYDEALDLLQGRLGRAEAEARTSLRTRQLAKRQRTWFRHQVDAARVDAGSGDVAALGAAVMSAFGASDASGC